MLRAFVLSFVFALAWSWTATQTLAAKPAVDIVVSDGFALVVDGDYSWAEVSKEMQSGNLDFGTSEYKEAHDMCVAFGDAVAAAQKANREGDYAKAESLAPEYVMKAWYGLNHLRALMGGTRVGKNWKGYDLENTDVSETSDNPVYGGPNSDAIVKEAILIRGYIAKAKADGKTADSKGNGVADVEKWLDHYKEGILAGVVK